MNRILITFLFFCTIISSLNCAVPQQLIKDFVNKRAKKANNISCLREKSQKKYLKKFNNQQEKLFFKLCSIKPEMSDILFAKWTASKQRLERQLKFNNHLFYSPSLIENRNCDSTLLILKYYGNDSVDQISQVYKESYQRDQVISEYMKEQNTIMRDLRKQVPEINNFYKKLNEHEYYFGQQSLEFTSRFSKLNKSESVFLSKLNCDQGFTKYFNKYSNIACNTKVPDNWGEELNDLQTNESIKELQKLHIKNLDSIGISNVVSNITNANKALDNLKFSGFMQEDYSPEFKPNYMKTKRFIDRINYGYDFQFLNSASNFLPSGVSSGLSLKYNLNNYFSIGSGINFNCTFEEFGSLIENISEKSKIRIFSDLRLQKTLFFTMIIEKVPPSKSNTENIKSKTNMKYECISGLKIIVPISSTISFTSALLFNFNSSKENPISFVFGLEL